MVLKMLIQSILVLQLLGCSAIGYVKYEDKSEVTRPMEFNAEEGKENKYIVKEYYLVPEEWWLEYPAWRFSFGFYLWDPYWWYPDYYTHCPGCYLFDPYVFKEHRRFEKRGIDAGAQSEPESGTGETFREFKSEDAERGGRIHRRFER
jgi:hypothetical protein